MNITNVAASILLLLTITACQEKAQSIEEDNTIQPQQQQYEQGKIDTHGTE